MLELRLAFRQLRLHPGFAAVVILTLALGIGANTAFFSVINSLLLQPLPLAEADRVVVPTSRYFGEPFLVSPAEYSEWRRQSQEHVSFGAAYDSGHVLAGRGEPQQLNTARIDENYLPTLGVVPVLGRGIRADDVQTNAPVVLLNHAYWQREYGADPSVIDQSMVLDGQPHTIIGVLPAGFDLPTGDLLYVPLASADLGGRAFYRHNLFVVGRLKADSTLERSNAELQAISAALAKANPEQRDWSVKVVPLRRQLMEDVDGVMHRRLLLLGSAVGLLLLIACANVGNLILARALNRYRDFGITAALGAGPSRLFRAVLLESTVVSVLGASAGVLLAAWLTPLVPLLSPVQSLALSPLLENPQIDGRVLLFTAGLTVLTALLAGLPAALRASRLDLTGSLQSGGGRGGTQGAGGWRSALVTAEVALCLMLLVGAGLIGRSFVKLLNAPLGFDPRGVLALRIAPNTFAHPNHAARLRLIEEILQRVRQLPTVQQVGVVSTLPLHLDGWSAAFVPETGPLVGSDQIRMTSHRIVTPGYLEAMRVELLEGRLINEDDRAGSPRVVVVTRTFAEQAWPGENAIGQRVRRQRAVDEWMTVVGVIAPVKEGRTAGIRADQPAWYLPYSQYDFTDPVHIVVRATGKVQNVARSVSDAVHKLDPGLPVYEILPLEQHVHAFLAPERFAVLLLVAFAVVGLLLAALGIYGVTAYHVGTRQREIGVRLALGATPHGVRTMVFRHGLRLIGAGIVIGLVGGAALGHLFKATLHNVSPFDPLVFTIVLAVILTIATAASFLPAQRAARLDPAGALRSE